VENVTDYAILMLSADGRVATWTEGAERTTGWSEQEVLGRPISIFYPPEDVEAGAAERDLRTAAAQGRCEATAWRVRRDGTRLWASVVLTAVSDADGRLLGFGQIMRDLTERREGALRTANPAAEALTGYAVDDVAGAPFWTLIAIDDRARVREMFGAAAAGEARTAETAITDSGGRRVEVMLRLLPIMVGGAIHGVYCIAEDITERKRAEAERETLLLRERIARAEAEAANAAKSDFLAVVTHELKTPLNVITGFADILRDGDAGALNPDQARYVDRVRAGAGQLLGMIDDVLAYARMDAGEPVRLERVELGALLAEVAAGVEGAAREKGLEVTIERDDSCVADTDPRRLRQVLSHLLGNAVKFTERGEVRAGARREPAALTITVTDTGAGIRPEHLERIWEPFWQAEDPLVRRAGGTGMGLSVARRLAQLLGGEIEARSTPGEGSVFTVRLPLVRD
jgi:PAS domain S-box-containing protein